MDNLGRLVGFLVPAEHSFKKDEHNKFCYDCNTFYVVFVDLSHRFYKVEKNSSSWVFVMGVIYWFTRF